MLGGATVRAKPLVGLLVLVAGVRFGTNGFYDVTALAGVEPVSGIVALTTAALAGYLALALGLEDTRHRTVLPTGRRGSAARAITDGLDGQIASLSREAGVRSQL